MSLFTLGAWHCFLSALSGLSIFEFGAMSLLSPVVIRSRNAYFEGAAITLDLASDWIRNSRWMVDGEC